MHWSKDESANGGIPEFHFPAKYLGFFKLIFLIFLSSQFPNLFIILLYCVYFCGPTQILLGIDSLNNQLKLKDEPIQASLYIKMFLWKENIIKVSK